MTRRFCLLAGLVLIGTRALTAQPSNRPVPAGIFPYVFVAHDTTFQGYYLTAPFNIGANAGAPTALMILDSKGYLVWYSLINSPNLLDFKFDAQRGVYQFVQFQSPQKTYFRLLDSGFHALDTFSTTNGILSDVHDFQISRNNTFLITGASDSLMDLHQYQFGTIQGSDTTHAVGFVVQEFDAHRQLLFQWDSNDHINPGTSYAGYGYNPAAFDYCHGNSVAEDDDDNLLLSFRNLNAVYKIDRKTGAVLWQLGGKTSTFSFPNDPGFSGQHDVRRLPNGRISLFDNGNQAVPLHTSRAVEYELDTFNWTATKVWEYRYVPLFFSPAMGNHQVTTDRRHLINYGLNYRPDPSFALVDDAKKRLAELFFADSVVSYRSYVFNLPLDPAQRPRISCQQNGGLVTLSAPPGYAQYAWSTGESSASIQATAAGTYQLWVNHGTGMLGSEPLTIQTLSAACPLSSTAEPVATPERTPLAYYDLLGRPVAAPVGAPTGGRVYVVRYADGRTGLIRH